MKTKFLILFLLISTALCGKLNRTDKRDKLLPVTNTILNITVENGKIKKLKKSLVVSN